MGFLKLKVQPFSLPTEHSKCHIFEKGFKKAYACHFAIPTFISISNNNSEIEILTFYVYFPNGIL